MNKFLIYIKNMRIKIKFFKTLYFLGAFFIFALTAAAPYKSIAGDLDHFKTINVYTQCKKIKQFDISKITKSFTRQIDYTKEIEITIFNDSLQALRFKTEIDNRIISFNYGLTYELYEFYEDGMLSKITCFDANGAPFGEPGTDDISAREFIIEDYKNLKRKMRAIGSGNSDACFEEKMRPVLMRTIDFTGAVMSETPISTTDYWLWSKMKFTSLKTPIF